MCSQRVERVVGGGQHFEVEPAEQGPRPELGLSQPLREQIEVARRGIVRDPEQMVELAGDPVAGGGPGEGRPTGAELRPHVTRFGGEQAIEPNAVGMQQAGHIVVGGDEQGGRIGEGPIVGQHARVDVAVHRQDR